MAHIRPSRVLLNAIGVTLLLVLAPVAQAQELFRVADGLAIYLGVVPAELIKGHPGEHAEARMHGSPQAGPRSYHVMAAVFDQRTGARLEEASVKARVAELGLAGTEKPLEPMRIADTVTFGDYFDLRNNTLFRIQIEILGRGARTPVRVEFIYKLPQN